MQDNSNKFDMRKAAAYKGITIIKHPGKTASEDRYEIYDAPYGKMPRRDLTKLMVQMINIPQHELALAYTEFHFSPQAQRAEFGMDGHFLYVA